MQTIKYDTKRLVGGTLGGVMFAIIGAACLGGHGRIYFIGLLGIILGPVLSAGSAKLLLSDQIALRWDERGLEVATMWRRRKLRWNEIAAITITIVTTRAFFGLVKTGENESLVIKLAGGIPGVSNYNISRGLVGLTPDAFNRLMVELEAVRMGDPVGMTGGEVVPARRMAGNMPQTRPAPAFAVANYGEPAESVGDYRSLASERPDDAEFDPDAIMARYLADKQRAEMIAGAAAASTATSRAPSLNGRPMLATTAPVARAGFGRKGL